MKKQFSKDVLKIDPETEVARICQWMRQALGRVLRKRGVVVAVSGGIDSSVSLGLAVKALGKDKALALMMPERDSDEDTLRYSSLVVDHYGCKSVTEDITPTLAAVGHYERYVGAARQVIPEYEETWKSKITISDQDKKGGLNYFYLIAQKPDGKIIEKRLPLGPYLEIVAATNFKQRTRKILEYYYADRFNYAVCGTPNRLEYDQGFFVKNGDGAADIKPIAHLFKSQVYQLAELLEVPEEIRRRLPTTDTYSLPQGQDEFYFSVPYDIMDLCLYGKNHGVPSKEVAKAADMSTEQVERVYEDIDRKRLATKYLHLPALLAEEVAEIK